MCNCVLIGPWKLGDVFVLGDVFDSGCNLFSSHVARFQSSRFTVAPNGYPLLVLTKSFFY